MKKTLETLQKEQPRELIINNIKQFTDLEKENGLNEIIFRIKTLNFLEVSKTSLRRLGANIDLLVNLNDLVLIGNQLDYLPETIGNLKRLKSLNVSDNRIESLPDELGKLTELQALNLNGNVLTALPETFSQLINLSVIKFNNNKVRKFPRSLCSANLKVHLLEIHCNHNEIDDLPAAINNLSALKILDLSDNAITLVPGELADCAKLKDLNLKGNQLKDRRLLKLVDQARQKQIMDYIKANCARETVVKKDDNKQQQQSNDKQQQESNNDEPIRVIKLLAPNSDDTHVLTATPIALEMRKIVCCLVRNVCFKEKNSLKKFLSLQTQLHETICNKRQAATLATHDLMRINGMVTFDLKPPTKIKLLPLNRNKEMSAQELYKVLNEEADVYRKEKKRTSYSGIHKYLYLLKGKQRYPCLIDSSDVVISFPPLTNSHVTKVSEETEHLLIEVTGESVNKCKEVLEALLNGMLNMGITKISEEIIDDRKVCSLLEVEPVRIVDPEGKLCVFYPSRVDLKYDDVTVIREAKTAEN